VDEESLYINAGVANLQFGAGANPAQPNAYTQTAVAIYRCPSDSGPVLNDKGLLHATSNYVAVAGLGGETDGGALAGITPASEWDWGGVMFPNSKVRIADITDGLSVTVVVGECKYYEEIGCFASIWAGMTGVINGSPSEGCWAPVWRLGGELILEGTPQQTWQPMINNGGLGFNSWHPGGANFGFCDGSVRFLLQDMDPQILMRLAVRNDGVSVNIPD
jgi:prepilin-type processing-associated H-X9-DG protein